MSRPPFRERADAELCQIADAELITYMHEAQEAGKPAAAKRALAIFVYGHWDRIRWRVALKVPEGDAEDVTGLVVASALGTVFRGESVGELYSLIDRIMRRRIADYHRARGGRPTFVPLPSLTEQGSGGEPAIDSEAGAVEASLVFDQLLGELSPAHRRVVELKLLEGRSAAEVSGRVEGITEANADQIASRFRKQLRPALRGGDTGTAT